jgi:hypothetical protein
VHRLGGDVGREEAEGGAKKGCTKAEGVGYVGRTNVATLLVEEVGGKRSVREHIIMSEMKNAADDGEDGTEFGVATMGKTDDFAADTVLLIGEGERGEGGRPERLLVGSGGAETDRPDEQLDITHTEGCVVGRRCGVFARAEKEEEHQHNHISDSKIVDGS